MSSRSISAASTASRRRGTRRADSGAWTWLTTTPTATASSPSSEVTVGGELKFRAERYAHQGSVPEQPASFCSETASGSGAQFDYRGGHIIDNSIENLSAATSGQLPWAVGPDRAAEGAGAGRGGASPATPNVVVFHEPGWFIKMRELSAHLQRARQLGPELPRQPAQPHPGGPEPVHHHGLQRGRSRGQRVRTGQLRRQRLRVAATGDATTPRGSTSASERGAQR